MKRLLNVFEFLKSIIWVNLAVSIVAGLLTNLSGFVTTMVGVGFVASLAVYEVSNRRYYHFYRTNGLSQFKLWLTSYIFTVIVALVVALLYMVIYETST